MQFLWLYWDMTSEEFGNCNFHELKWKPNGFILCCIHSWNLGELNWVRNCNLTSSYVKMTPVHYIIIVLNQITVIRLHLTSQKSICQNCENWTYSKTCEKRATQKDRKLVFKTNYFLMQVKSIAECSKGSILRYFRPSLSYHLSLRSMFRLFFSGRFTQVLL